MCNVRSHCVSARVAKRGNDTATERKTTMAKEVENSTKLSVIFFSKLISKEDKKPVVCSDRCPCAAVRLRERDT